MEDEIGEESWHAARLIPTSGINGAEEQERRATSALLAVMVAVKEFGRALLSDLGAPAGAVESFVEVPFEVGEKTLYPDGLLRVRRGQRTWTSLVEVKTGNNPLESDQLNAYLDIARDQGFDALLTISNQIEAVPGDHPTAVDKRKLKKVALHHLSWTQVLTEAVVQKVHRGVADQDQAWVLGELIRYLEHPRSGALEFDDMGPSWVSVRESVGRGTLRPIDKGVAEVASRFDQTLRYASLRLGRQLGVEVQPGLSKKDLADPAGRATELIASITTTGILVGGLRIPNAVGPIGLVADLRAGKITASVDVAAPEEGRPQDPGELAAPPAEERTRRPPHRRLHQPGAFGKHIQAADRLRSDPMSLVLDSKAELRRFHLAMSGPMGVKRSGGRGAFVTSVVDLVESFYVSVVQGLKGWQALAPKVRTAEEEEIGERGVAPALVSTALSSQDGAMPASAGPPTQEDAALASPGSDGK